MEIHTIPHPYQPGKDHRRLKLERRPRGRRSLPQEEKDEHYRPSSMTLGRTFPPIPYLPSDIIPPRT